MIGLFTQRRAAMFALLVALGLAQAGAAAAGALAVRTLFDSLGPEFDVLSPASAWLAAAVVLVSLLESAQRMTAETLAIDYASAVRLQLFDHVSRVPAGELSRRNQGTLLLPFVGDLGAIRAWVGKGLARLVVGGVLTLGLLAALALTAPPVAAACALVLAAAAAGVLLLGLPIERAVREHRRRRAGLTSLIASRIAALATVQALAGAHRERARIARRDRAMNRAGRRRALLSAILTGLARLTSGALAVATLLAGGVAVAGGQLSAGGVAAAVGLVSLMAPAIFDLGRAAELWRPAKVAGEKIAALLAVPPRSEPARVPVRRGAAPLVMEGVALGPSGPTLDLKLRRGAVALLRGDVDTREILIRLAAGLADPAAGRVRVGGRDAASLSPSRRRALIGYAGPETPLLRDSLRRNLTYRTPDATDEALADAIDLCGLRPLIERLPGGLGGGVTDRGANLTVAERQAVALARAFIGTPTLLVLDSADNDLDDEVLQRLAARLGAWSGGVLLVTRRAELIRAATEIWTLEAGRLSVERTPANPVDPSLCEAA